MCTQKTLYRLGGKRSISYIVPIVIVIVLIVAFAAGYLAGTGTGTTATQFQTVTYTTTKASATGASPTCVTLGNCPTAFVYIAYGASKDTGIELNPGNITVIIGVNNTVTWENLDTVSQTLAGTSSFSTQTLAPGASFSYTYTTPGVYPYSSPTYSFEKGIVTVIQSTATTSAVGSNPDDNY